MWDPLPQAESPIVPPSEDDRPQPSSPCSASLRAFPTVDKSRRALRKLSTASESSASVLGKATSIPNLRSAPAPARDDPHLSQPLSPSLMTHHSNSNALLPLQVQQLSLGPTAERRRPSLPSVFERASHPAAALRQAFGLSSVPSTNASLTTQRPSDLPRSRPRNLSSKSSITTLFRPGTYSPTTQNIGSPSPSTLSAPTISSQDRRAVEEEDDALSTSSSEPAEDLPRRWAWEDMVAQRASRPMSSGSGRNVSWADSSPRSAPPTQATFLPLPSFTASEVTRTRNQRPRDASVSSSYRDESSYESPSVLAADDEAADRFPTQPDFSATRASSRSRRDSLRSTGSSGAVPNAPFTSTDRRTRPFRSGSSASDSPMSGQPPPDGLSASPDSTSSIPNSHNTTASTAPSSDAVGSTSVQAPSSAPPSGSAKPPVPTAQELSQASSRVREAEEELLSSRSTGSSNEAGSTQTLSQRLAAYGESLRVERELRSAAHHHSKGGSKAYTWEKLEKDGGRPARTRLPVTSGERRSQHVNPPNVSVSGSHAGGRAAQAPHKEAPGPSRLGVSAYKDGPLDRRIVSSPHLGSHGAHQGSKKNKGMFLVLCSEVGYDCTELTCWWEGGGEPWDVSTHTVRNPIEERGRKGATTPNSEADHLAPPSSELSRQRRSSDHSADRTHHSSTHHSSSSTRSQGSAQPRSPTLQSAAAISVTTPVSAAVASRHRHTRSSPSNMPSPSALEEKGAGIVPIDVPTATRTVPVKKGGNKFSKLVHSLKGRT
jgi:hypothetical protein